MGKRSDLNKDTKEIEQLKKKLAQTEAKAEKLKTEADEAKAEAAEAKATRTNNEATPKREVVAHTNAERPARRPLTTAYKLQVPPGLMEEGYQYRFVKDTLERQAVFKDAWWTPVTDGDGAIFRKPDGSGGFLILMRIENKYFEEDQELNRKKPINLAIDKAKLDKDRYSSEYVPEGHEAVLKIGK